jgi:hypothetical protein
MFSVTIWKTDETCFSTGGTIYYSSNPPGAWWEHMPESFFDVYLEPQTFRNGVGPGTFLPGDCFTLIATVVFDTVPGTAPLPDLVCEEYVCVDANGLLYRPATNCPPSVTRIPTSLSVGDFFCFKVCHDVYWIPLNCNLPGPPHFTVIEGCLDPTTPNCYDPECLLPDPNCYVISKEFCGGVWWLRFEYSCAYREPVCYCITFDWQLPVELLYFNASSGDEIVTLHWSTATENNNASFEISRSADANGDYQTVATLPGAGTSSATSYYTWSDRNVTNGTTYWYRLTSVDVNGNRRAEGSAVAATPTHIEPAVASYELRQNYPNPFNASTMIEFDLPVSGFVTLTVYNVTGQEVAVLQNGEMGYGLKTVRFDAGDLPSGIYVYRLAVNGFEAHKKMLLIR